MTQSLTIQSLDGLSLEAELDEPDDPKGAVVFCHPHPRMGGTMNAPLLLAVRDALVDAHWAVLRFNFRGIGSSEGTSQMGIDEVADARGALAMIRERIPSVPVAIAGWSFGAAVALRTIAQDHEIAAGVFIAPAIDERPGVTAGAPDPSEIEIVAPSLILCGTNDHLVDEDRCRRWADSVPGVAFMPMTGANHFFWGKYEALASAVVSFLQEAV
jgi:alpha/beta superfamily hydrolase